MENITKNKNGIRGNILPIQPLTTPIIPHEIICHIVHIPIPSNKLETNTTITANNNALTGPNMTPAIIMIAVTGCTLGRNANQYLPITASVARIAIRVSLYVCIYKIISKPENQKLFCHPALIYIQQRPHLAFRHSPYKSTLFALHLLQISVQLR